MNTEAAVISAVCENKDINVLMSENVADIFVSHKDVVDSLISYYHKYNAVPDVDLLVEKFNQFFPEEVSGPTDYYIDRLRDEFVQSKLREALMSAGQSLSSDSATRTLDLLMKDLTSLSKYSATVKDINLTDVESAEKHYESIRLHRDSHDGNVGIYTGFRSVDSSIPSGLAPGNLIIMLGYSGRGKSWLAGYFAKQAFLQGKRPMLVSMEMTAAAMRDRIYATMGNGIFSMADFQTGDIDTDDFREWGKKHVEDRQDFIIVSSDGVAEVNVTTLQAKIDQYKPDILVVDYIQLMADNAGAKNETEKIRNISRGLKRLALRNNIPIIAISAVTATDLSVPDEPPMLEQVAWSRSIQYDADVAIAVHKYEDTDILEVCSRKNRFGPDFSVFLKVDLSRGKIEECFDDDMIPN